MSQVNYTIWALILPGALPVSNMVILMNFIRELPAELEEAASLDGESPFQTHFTKGLVLGSVKG